MSITATDGDSELDELDLPFPAEDVVVRRGADGVARADVLAVLRLCAAGGVRCSATTRRPAAASVSAVRDVLSQGDFYPRDSIAAFAWPLLLQAAGLAELAGTRLQLTAKGRAALTAPPEQTIKALWSRWLTGGLIDEMSRVEAIKGQKSARALTAVGPRRKAVGAALAECPLGEWLLVDDLFHRVSRSAHLVTVARDPWKLYLVDREYGSLGYDGYGDWSIIEGRYTLAVLFEYAGTLGLFDLIYTEPDGARDDFVDNWGGDCLDALSRYDGLLAVRLNALGAYVMGVAATYEPPDDVPDGAGAGESGDGESGARPLKVLATHDVVMTGTLAPGQQLVLDSFAEHTSERVWTVRIDTVLAALGAGRSTSEFADFLRSGSATPVPDTLTRLLDDAQARARVVRSEGPVQLITCADAATAALIARDRRASRYCRPVGDRHLAVALEHEARFRAALLAIGYPLPPAHS